MIEAMTKLSHKTIMETPNDLYSKLIDPTSSIYIGFVPKIDVCASVYVGNIPEFESLEIKRQLSNSKCYEYITEEQDFFKTEVKKDAWGNFPYLKSAKGVKGMDKFFERAYIQHVNNRINFAILAFTVITSSKYYQKYVGPKAKNVYGEKVDLIHIPDRVFFQCRHGMEIGTPAFSSFVIVFRDYNIPKDLKL